MSLTEVASPGENGRPKRLLLALLYDARRNLYD
jgi:hypothetical protein